MIGLVIEKNSFKGKDKTYNTLYLTVKGKDDKFRVAMDKKSNYKNIRSWFVPEQVFDSVDVGCVYDFKFGADEDTGYSAIVDCVPSAF